MIFGMLLWFSLSLGLQDYNEAGYVLGFYTHPPVCTEINIHAENDWLALYVICQNEMVLDTDSIFLLPVQAYYTIGSTISIGCFSIDFRHMCQHPVANVQRSLTGEYGGYTKLEVSFSSNK